MRTYTYTNYRFLKVSRNTRFKMIVFGCVFVLILITNKSNFWVFFFSIKTVTKSYKMDTTNFGLESVGEIRCKAHCTGKRWYTGSDNLLSTWLPKQYYLYCVITLWQRQETAKLSLNGLTTCGGVLFICGFTV